jgi:hypothetical protein
MGSLSLTAEFQFGKVKQFWMVVIAVQQCDYLLPAIELCA